MEIDKKEYGKYVKQVTPVHNTWKNLWRAFLVGGLICMLGQVFTSVYMSFGIGCKIFTIAGPVILYGILASWVLGMVKYFWRYL